MKLLRKIKNIFLPTESNNKVPLALSEKTFYLFIIIAFSLIIPTVYTQVNYLSSVIDPTPFSGEEVVELLNKSRINNGLSSLSVSNELSLAAQNKLNHMIQEGYFSHFAPDGTSPWDFIKGIGYKYSAAGENLAVDFATAESTHHALMRSPSHRSNILSNLYSEIGVAVARGDYQNREVIYIVQMFGDPEPQVVNRESIASANVEEVESLPENITEDVIEEPIIENETPEIEDNEVSEGLVESASESMEEESIIEEENEKATSSITSQEVKLLSVVGSLLDSFTSSNKTKALTSILVIIVISTSLLFLLTREHSVSNRLIARSFLVIFIFTLLIFQSYNEVLASKITPFAQQNISYSIDK